MKLKKIAFDVNLWNEDSERVFDIYSDTGRNLVAVNDNAVFTYRLTKMPQELSDSESERILNYSGLRLTEEVTVRDIFMHGEFVTTRGIEYD